MDCIIFLKLAAKTYFKKLIISKTNSTNRTFFHLFITGKLKYENNALMENLKARV